MVVLDGLKEAVTVAPAASCGRTAVVFAFDVDRRVPPKRLRRLGVEIGAGRVIDKNAVVAETVFVFGHFRHQQVVFLFEIGADDKLLSAFIHDIDEGVEPAYPIRDIKHYYDRQALTDYINGLF